MKSFQTSRVKLDDLQFIEHNPRRHTEIQIKELMRSVEKFGQIRPLVIDEDNTVIAGNGLLVALRELGWSEGDAYVVVGMSHKDKMRLALADNKVASLGLDNYTVIDQLIKEIGGDLDIPGFDDDILLELIASTAQITDTARNYGVTGEEYNENAMKRQEGILEADAIARNTTSGSTGKDTVHCDSCGQRIWS